MPEELCQEMKGGGFEPRWIENDADICLGLVYLVLVFHSVP